jgi:hypothetical protein
VLEGSFHKRSDLVEAYVDEVGRDITRLDLRKVEDIVDELDEVITATVDGLCVTYLFLGKVTLVILK